MCVCIYVMRKPWIGTIHGLRCSKYGSMVNAGNPWIAQHLRDPWIAQSNRFGTPAEAGTPASGFRTKQLGGAVMACVRFWKITN